MAIIWRQRRNLHTERLGLQVYLPYSERFATDKRRIYRRNKAGTSAFAEHTQVWKRSSNRKKLRDGDRHDEVEAKTNLLQFPMCNILTSGNQQQVWKFEMSQYTIRDTSNCLNTINSHNTNYNMVSDDMSPLLTLLWPPNAGLWDSDSHECHVTKAGKWLVETEAVFATGQSVCPRLKPGPRILSRPPPSPVVPCYLPSASVILNHPVSSSTVLRRLPLFSFIFWDPLHSPAITAGAI